MPKNFDDLLSKDRSFIVRGETFTFHDVKPEVLSSFKANGKSDPWQLIDAQINLFLSESDQKRWKELRSRDAEPVTIAQMNDLLTWLLEEQTDRPTNPPSPSVSGPGKSAA
jgi:glycosidase